MTTLSLPYLWLNNKYIYFNNNIINGTLVLTCNNFKGTDEEYVILTFFLKTKIKHLILDCIKFSLNGLNILYNFYGVFKTECIFFTSNNLGDDHILFKKVINILVYKFPKLSQLSFIHNSLTEAHIHELYFLINKTHLRRLSLGLNYIKEKNARFLLEKNDLKIVF